jgi:hypothetical protein
MLYVFSNITFSIIVTTYLSIYGSTALVDLDHFFISLIHTQSVGLLGRWTSPSQGCYLYIEQHNLFNSHSGGWSPSWVHSAHRPLNGLLYLPRVSMMMENLVE